RRDRGFSVANAAPLVDRGAAKAPGSAGGAARGRPTYAGRVLLTTGRRAEAERGLTAHEKRRGPRRWFQPRAAAPCGRQGCYRPARRAKSSEKLPAAQGAPPGAEKNWR